ncbi:2-oxoacid dehydrogenases acyltransferase (catalytic domain) [Streptomyces sp. 2231.1]|uniref:2-oxo acid dehydrogenase subunit E2 n=1 Tax=Streptomyces sp. 2231.1 TaxID=1855347 RepID=UPI000899DD5B|nr:2-oxo acid dehydrogenase subunit E2 [Streptomyces sp. 2231.1]SEE00121.1 2-oxoacid dehydrogenases acyltransferase (catalytic domain) [Streptomyces sp. 2231.1]
MSGTPVPHSERRRRHTLYFLEWAADQRPVHLDTEVDMTRIQEHRAAARAEGTRISVVSYLLHATGRVLARHPRANAVLAPGWPSALRRPRTLRFGEVTAKLALDRTLDGERTVLSALVPGLESASLQEIQDRVDRFRGADAGTLPEFKGVRMLGRLPVPLGRAAFAAALRSPRRRPEVFGTVSVSSLGHRDVDGFHSAGGTAVTLCAGRIIDRAVVRAGQVVPAPVMRLGLTFDHRVIDGATAADVLSDLRHSMEEFDDGSREGVPGPDLRGTDHDQRAARGLEQSPR